MLSSGSSDDGLISLPASPRMRRRSSHNTATTSPMLFSMDSAPLSEQGSLRRRILDPGERRRNFPTMPVLRRDSKLVICCRHTVRNKYFIAFSTLLTLYALVGDDFRLLATELPWDMVFNGITLVCLAHFTTETTCSCIGRKDYFLGFFFWLDVISTASLVLDLTWVSDYLLGNGEDLDRLRSGKSARAGARLGRVVRVIRLVRILKLYKQLLEARARQRARQRAKERGQTEDDDDWLDDDDTPNMDSGHVHMKESRVGKKLSDLTTRKVIMLVLAMLLVLPFLRMDTGEQNPMAAFLAADDVWLHYQELKSGNTEAQRLAYEQSFLRNIYYFNWFTGHSRCPIESDETSCPEEYLSHLFWGGIVSETAENLEAERDYVQVRAETVKEWDAMVQQQDSIYLYGSMPSQVVDTMASTWSNACVSGNPSIYRVGFSVLKEEIRNKVAYKAPCPDDLRNVERFKYSPRLLSLDQHKSFHFAFYFDLRPFTSEEAMFGILITLFVCVVLCVASLTFSSDANALVLKPVEAMIKRVELIADDPLVAMKMADEEFKVEEREKARARKMTVAHSRQLMKRFKDLVFCTQKQTNEAMETVILEKTIIKLGSLLALGFGEAGANIIGHNMGSSNTAVVDAMIPGERVECIVAVARIRDFSTATEVLQAKVMTFVNQIAEVVHGVVDEFHGAANKNNGETFLLVWNISGLGDEIQLRSRLSEMSLIAFAKIVGAIQRSPLLAKYRQHPGLQQRLGSKCRVSLSFGLHAGWAIEGAVGTEYKIDASYLSPNVSIVSSVERASSIYGVPIVISQAVVEMCSKEMKKQLRLIDDVIIRGSTEPIRIYSLDLDYMEVQVDRPAPYFTWNSRQRYKARQSLESEKQRKLHPDVRIVALFQTIPDLNIMRKRYTTEFLQLFNMGYQNYAEGEWQVAQRMLLHTSRMLRQEDGPSAALLRFMETPYGFRAPEGWQGVRDLALLVS